MASKRKMEDKRGKGPFVQIFHSLLLSEAYRNLSHAGFRVYVHLRYKFRGRNRDNLSLTYKEMEKALRMNRRTFRRAILELIDKGFITIQQHGGLMNRPNIYGLSGDWARWSPKTEDNNSTAKSEEDGDFKIKPNRQN